MATANPDEPGPQANRRLVPRAGMVVAAASSGVG
jgi:hypothetical protein